MDAGPEVEAPLHHNTGRRWLDVTLSISAISISLMSALLAFQHGNAMEDMVRQNAHMVEASTWPYVTPGFSNSDPRGGHLYKIMVSNNGVGPAKIERIDYSYKGRTAQDRIALAKLVAADAGHAGALGISMSDTGGVLPQGRWWPY